MSGSVRRPCRRSMRLSADTADKCERLRQYHNCQTFTDVIERIINSAHWETIGVKEFNATQQLAKKVTSKIKKVRGK